MYSTRGFVLRRYDAGEADRMYIVYTENFGKKNLFGKGTRKIKSKLSPHLTEFAVINLDFVRGKYYDKIIGAQIEKVFPSFKNNLRKIAIGSFIMDVTDNLIKQDHPDRGIYRLMEQALEIIDGHQDIKKAYFSANIFIWKMLILLGYKPELDKCARCGLKFDEIYFDWSRCELICGECWADQREGMALSKEKLYLGKPHPSPLPFGYRSGQALKGEGAIRRSSLEYLKGNPMPDVDFNEIIFIIKSFMRLHLEKVLKSEVWIEKLF